MSPPSNSKFWSTLLELDDEVDVKVLTHRDVCRATTTWSNAFIDDPLVKYVSDNKPKSHLAKRREKIAVSLFLHGWIRRKICITVNNGASLVVATPAPSASGPTGPRENLIDWLLATMVKIGSKTRNKVTRRRNEEVKRGVAAALKDKIGSRLDDMIHVDLVCTDPASQGHGFASALLDTITRLADMLDTPCWLESSNINNEAFYNSHGFKAVGEVLAGESDPSWHEKPVIVQIMVREPSIAY